MEGGALGGLEVVAIEQAVAAPYCTSRLADAGANVIKIERPEGDFARGYDRATPAGSSYFVWLNRGKKSVLLDLREAEARAVLDTLIARADVLVQNLKPGALARMGFDIADLRKRFPALICCSISGYGETGPLARRKAYDLLIQAEAGLCSITGTDAPARVGISIVDIATGATAHAAILEALIARGRTGEGADIRVSMFDVMADWLAVPLLNAEAGHAPGRSGLSHPSIAPYGVFRTSDDEQLLLSVQSDREWRSFAEKVLRTPQLGSDPRFATNLARVANRAETDRLVGECLAGMRSAEAEALLDEAAIAFARLNDMDALRRHPHLRRMTVLSEAGALRLPAPGAVVDGRAPSAGAVPALGEHTAEVLRSLGIAPPG